jgi:uncharacterized membrane protein YjjP (DUF1212 family)
MSSDASSNSPASKRMAFVVEIARRLHQYGTSAGRLEDAIDSVSARLRLNCQPLSTPTSIVFSFSDRASGDGALAELTQVIRVSPGQDDLANLSAVNDIADCVTAGTIDIDEGFRRLREIRDQPTVRRRVLETLAYGIAAAAVAAILNCAWVDLATAFAIGSFVGALAAVCERRPRLRPSLEALSALFATLLATVVDFYVTPLNLQAVVLASLIVLLPGLSLTTAVRELSTQHLVSGVARFGGAVATLIKLAFGTVVANQICQWLRLVPEASAPAPIPSWAQWIALAFGCFSFAVLFRCARRDIPLAMAAAALGYLITYYGGKEFSPQFGVFLAGCAIGALSNLYARVSGRPGALVRIPGIILLVPGSIGFLTLAQIAQRDVFLGINSAITLTAVLVSLVAGLLFGDLLVPPRRVL